AGDRGTGSDRRSNIRLLRVARVPADARRADQDAEPVAACAGTQGPHDAERMGMLPGASTLGGRRAVLRTSPPRKEAAACAGTQGPHDAERMGMLPGASTLGGRRAVLRTSPPRKEAAACAGTQGPMTPRRRQGPRNVIQRTDPRGSALVKFIGQMTIL